MLSKFTYVKPTTLTEALECLKQHGTAAEILAGGTDLLVALRRNQLQPAVVVDVKGVKELNEISYTPGKGLFLGAAVTVNQLAEFGPVKQKYQALAEAANRLASYQLRNRATVGGNICNASPAADLAPPLLIYEAEVRLASPQGTKVVPLQQFITGVKRTVLQPGELVQGVFLPEVEDFGSLYLKQGRIKGHDLSIVGLAARLTRQKRFRLALGAVAPTPLRLTQLEDLLNAQPFDLTLVELAAREVNNYISPISDVRASADYRRHMARVFVQRAIRQLVAAGGDTNG